MFSQEYLEKVSELQQQEINNCLVLANSIRLLFGLKELPDELLAKAEELESLGEVPKVRGLFRTYCIGVSGSRIKNFDLCFMLFSKRPLSQNPCLGTVLGDQLLYLGGFGLEYRDISKMSPFIQNFYRFI